MARSRDELLSAYDNAVRRLERRKDAAIAKGDREAYDAANRDAREEVRRLRAEARKGGKR